MYFPTFLSTAALALTANAFLIPPEIADEVQAAQQTKAKQLHNALEKARAKAGEIFPQIVDHTAYDINLDCSSCPFALKSERNGVHEWTNGVQTDLHMHFASQGDHLTIYGQPFFSVANEKPGTLVARQVRKASESSKEFEAYQGYLHLSYGLEFQTVAETEEDSLIDIDITVFGIDGQMVKIDDISMKVNKHKKDGALTILSIETVAPSPNDPDAKCANMACRAMVKLAAAMAHARAKAAQAAHKAIHKAGHTAHKVKCFCMHSFHRLSGHPAAPKSAGDGKTTKLPTHNVFRPGQLHPQHHDGQRHHPGVLRTVMGFAKNIFTFVILPVMVGVAVGITASAIGMLVGQAVVFLWMKYRRTGNTAYEVVQTDDKEDNLPAYEAENLPAYTEGETVVVAVDEKEALDKA